MFYLRQAEIDAMTALEQVVINGTPDEVTKIYKRWSGDIFTAHILGIAGRFRGLDMVKALVENGASFRQNTNAAEYIFSELSERYNIYLGKIKDEDFVRIMSTLLSEIGADKKFHFTDWLCHINGQRFFTPVYFVFYLEHFLGKTRLGGIQ